MSGGTKHPPKGVAVTTAEVLAQIDEQYQHLVTLQNTISASLAADQVAIHEELAHLRGEHDELAGDVGDLSQRVAKLEQIVAGESHP